VVVVDRNTLHAAKQVGAMLIFNTIIRVSGGADYGMKQYNPDIRNIQRGPIHRHLHCHPERSEGSVAVGKEMLRGVYTERSECAQHDRAVTHRPRWVSRHPNEKVKNIIAF
jgi:hypothetical protein